MKILFLSSEVAPFSKTGGLADVAAALPGELAKIGHEVWVATPLYASVPRDGLTQMKAPITLQFPFGKVTATLWQATLAPNHHVLFIDAPNYFAREGLYHQDGHDFPDNHRRFAFFSMAALTAAQQLKIAPDVVHLNDWQTGLAAVALKDGGYRGTDLGRATCVFTIHNLAYQGVFPKTVVEELGLPWSLFTPEKIEFYDQLSFLKAGLSESDLITTVSPTYAKEIQTPAGGWGLDGFLSARKNRLHGILNGIDTAQWNPRTDAFLPARYDASNLSGKKANKRALLEEMGLSDPAAPLLGLVSRLAPQKGIGLLLEVLPELLESPLSVAVLGNGEPDLEAALLELAAQYPGRVAVQLKFDERLAHWIEAGSDFFCMPSVFEPCGLNQMYSLNYGTVPVVRATGGLDDSVIDLELPKGNGIKFVPFEKAALLAACQRALALIKDEKQLEAVRKRGMQTDFSWTKAAREYISLYQSIE